MSKDLTDNERHITRFLLIHFIIILVLPSFIEVYGGVWDYIFVALVTGLALSFVDRRYGLYLIWSLVFLLYLIKEIIVSNAVLAWMIVQPRLKLDPGIIAVPLTVTTGLEITVLSLAIAATPGTMIVDLGQDDTGRYILYVHTVNVEDPDKFRASIKGGFERMILNISKGAAA